MKLLLSILGCIVFINGYSQHDSLNIYHADAKIQIHDLRNFTYVLVDSSNNLSEKDITGGNYDHLFQPYSSVKKTVNPYTTYWLKVSLSSAGKIDNWLLILRDSGNFYTRGAANDYVDVFITNPSHNIISNQRTGALVPRSQKTVGEFTAVNAISYSAENGQPATVYIKLYNEYAPPSSLFFPQLQNRIVPVAITDSILPVIAAVAFLFAILSFFFFFFVKERSYLYFGLYTFFLSQHYLILHPQVVFIDLYIPEHPFLVQPFFFFFAGGTIAIFLQFGRSFMRLKSLSRQTDLFAKWVIRIYLVGLAVEIVSFIITRRLLLTPGWIIASMAITFLLLVRCAFFKTFEARIYVIGGLFLYGFNIMGLMYNYEVISLPFNPWPVGQMGQLLIYSIGLAYKIRLNEKAKAEAEHIKGLEEIKSRFFANISHEFRTPLTLIQGPLQQIEESIPETQKQTGTVNIPWRQIKTMRRHTDRLLELVNQLLDLSKIDSGKMKLQVIKGDVLQMLKVLTASFESMAERKGIHYHVHFPEQTIIGFFDKDKLDKIVCNLLGNAFKYTPEQGTVSVIIEAEESRLRISIEDNGVGIPKKELDKVFDRFYQVEGTEDKGSGIGLALVKELVDLYRGQISVSSEPGKGSRFKVSLPVDKNSFREDELVYGEWVSGDNAFVSKSVDEKVLQVSSKNTSLQLPMVLIVEDNNDLRSFIRETLQNSFQIIECSNGREGLDKAISEVPDLIVSDVMMPVMDGFAMTEKLKKDERTSHIPVILLTAKAGQQHKIEGLSTGADDYLVKPFDAKELLTRIQNLVNQRKLLRKKFAGEIMLKPSEVAVNSADENFLTKVMKAIEENMAGEEFGVEELAREVAMSRSQLHRKLISLTGQSPSEVLRNTRLLRAKELLHKKAATPSEVAYQVGFNSHTYFSKCFKEEFGISPSEVAAG